MAELLASRNADSAGSTLADSGPMTDETEITVKSIRGKQYPDVDDPQTIKAAYIEALMRDGETEALLRYKQATRNLLFAQGRQWIDWIPNRKLWDELPVVNSDLRITANYIRSILRARSNRLMPDTINWRGIPDSNSYEARDRVQAAVMVIRSRYDQTDMEAKLRNGLWLAFTAGACALKSFWNPNIGPLTPAQMQFQQLPDGQMIPASPGVPIAPQTLPVDQNGQPVQDAGKAYHYRPGDSDTTVRTIFNLRLNPEARGWTPAEGFRWVIDSEVVSLAIAREKFPQYAKQITASDQSESSLTYERIAEASAVAKITDPQTSSPYNARPGSVVPGDVTVIREYWEAKSDFFPDGRLIVTVGKIVVYDDVWPQGILPYAPIFDEPGIMSPWGRPCVNDMIAPQQLINDEWTAIAKEMRAAGTNQWIAWAIPGLANQVTKEDNAILQVPMRNAIANRSIRDVVQRMERAGVPPDRWHVIQEAKNTIFDVGSFHEVSRGQIPPGLDSGVAIEHLLESESMQLKDAVEAFKRSLIAWGRQQLSICKWGYMQQDTRWVPIDRPDMGYMIEGVNGEDLPDAETISLDIEDFRPHSQAAQRAEVKDLMGLGILDQRTGMKIMDMGRDFDSQFESQTRHYSCARWENIDFERGQFQLIPGQVGQNPDGSPIMGPIPIHLDGSPFLLPNDDDHATHLDVHAEIALDPTKPWQVRQLVLQHSELHRQALMHLALQQQPPPPPPPPPKPSNGNG